jgi:hypothetical protein
MERSHPVIFPRQPTKLGQREETYTLRSRPTRMSSGLRSKKGFMMNGALALKQATCRPPTRSGSRLGRRKGGRTLS